MPRRSRFCPPGIPQHIIQRGNNRQICFCADEDFAAYANWLKEAAQKYQVQIHAWVFMTNHVHLLLTPADEMGVSLMMQKLGRQYVCYFNKTYRRSGTLWEGRFKSCLVQTDEYLLQCYRYIELNPVRANMVNDPAGYVWSSYRCNGLGVASALLTPHESYMALGDSVDERLENYRALFRHHVDEALVTEIRSSINSGLVLGSERFKDEVEGNLGQRARRGTAGRPKKYHSDPHSPAPFPLLHSGVESDDMGGAGRHGAEIDGHGTGGGDTVVAVIRGGIRGIGLGYAVQLDRAGHVVELGGNGIHGDHT